MQLFIDEIYVKRWNIFDIKYISRIALVVCKQ